MRLIRHAFLAALLAVGLALAGGPAVAVQPDEVLRDPALEARARALSRELRCMVCQNQSIDDSDAPLARDLRILVRDRLKAGDSDSEVLKFLTTRYGEFVLLRPRFTAQTAVLWLAPFLVLLIGIAALVTMLRRRRRPEPAGDSVPLSDKERRRLADLLDRGS